MSFSPKAGDDVRYRSICGDLYDAKVLREGPPGYFDISITGPGLKEPIPFRAIRIAAPGTPGLRPTPQEAA